MKKTGILLWLFFPLTVFSQSPDWINYVLKKDKTPVVVSVDVQFDQYKPSYKYLVIVSSEERRHCRKNGFPDPDGIAEADLFSDTIDSVIRNKTPYAKVGMLTVNCLIYDFFYVKDTTGLKQSLRDALHQKFSHKKNKIGIEKDKKWDFYYGKLFPPEFTEDFVYNHDILFQLVANGDNLDKKRDVRHWLYFNKESNRNKFIQQVKKMDYRVDSLAIDKKLRYPYELIIGKNEFVDPRSVNATTKMLNLLARNNRGIYDRWDTELIME